ncbi:MAG: hypothetical protein RMJ87_14185 [Cytophagales bacterium]|nr:hypothetical protein [Cytophagales bacterium]
MSYRNRIFLKKEFKRGIYAVSVWLATKVLSHVLSFNQQGAIYTEYYYNLMPFSFLDLLLVLYLLRTLIVFVAHFYSKRSVDSQP